MAGRNADGVNEFDTTHEIPSTRPEDERKNPIKGPTLLTMPEAKAAKVMMKEWDDSYDYIRRFSEQWKVNQARSQGFTGVKLVKTQDEARFYVPLGATPSVTSMNKAIRLKRRLRATLGRRRLP